MEFIKTIYFGNQNICFGPVLISGILIEADLTQNMPIRIIAEGPAPSNYRELYFHGYKAGKYFGEWFIYVVDPLDESNDVRQPRPLTIFGSHAVYRDQYFFSSSELEVPLHRIRQLTDEERAHFVAMGSGQ